VPVHYLPVPARRIPLPPAIMQIPAVGPGTDMVPAIAPRAELPGAGATITGRRGKGC